MPELPRIFRRIATSGVLLSFMLAMPALAAEAKREKTAGPLPTFSPRGGVFAGSVSVNVESIAPSTLVRFTLNGSDPTEKSESVSSELKLTGTTQIRARVFESGKTPGPVVSQTYTVIEKDLEHFTSNLPLVILNTFGREVLKEGKTPASVRVIDEKDGQSRLVGEANFDGCD